MDEKFEQQLNLCLIYSNDLKYLLLKNTKHGKLDGLLVNSGGKISQLELSKMINKELGLKIEPTNWQIVTTLQNINRDWKIDVYLTAAEIANVNKEGFELVNPNNLPENVHPNLKWLVPLSIDLTIFFSGFNQILMK